VGNVNQVPVSQRMHGVESNDTVEGRAHSRRVELACAANH
jgi:hypothetical protein